MTDSALKIIIHMVVSLDGFIAKKDNDTSWFETNDTYERGVVAQSSEDFLKTVDCFIMGAKTYELALALSEKHGWPYGDVPIVVVTHRQLPIHQKNVRLYSGDLTALVNEQLKPMYRNVWLAGGATLVRDFIRQKLAHEISITVLPVILGDGVPLFGNDIEEQSLHLKDVKAYTTGVVELTYELNKCKADDKSES